MVWTTRALYKKINSARILFIMQKVVLLMIVFFFTSFVFADTGKETDYVKQGIALFSKGRYQNAIRFFERALSEKPESEAAYVWLGKSYLKLGIIHS